MIRSIKSAVAGAGALAIAGGLMFAGAGAAHADAPPTFETPTGNPGTHGSVGFFNSAGVQVYGGAMSDDPIAAYFEAQGGPSDGGKIGATDHIATAYTYTPQKSTPADQWTTPFQLTGGDEFGAAADTATLPGALHNTTQAVAIGLTGGASVNDAVATFPLADTDDPNIVQVRITTSSDSSVYYSTDIKITGATWTQVFPTPVVASGVSAITAAPAAPTSATTSVALSATVTPASVGAVELFDGSTDLGAATYNAATGAISKTLPVTSGTGYNFKFTFTPSSGPAVSSDVLAYTVPAAVPAKATTTVVNSDSTGTAGSPVNISANVTDTTATTAVPTGAGSVQFKVNGSNVGALIPVTAGAASSTYVPSAAGTDTITAAFVPANGTYLASSSANTDTVVVSADTSVKTTDPQDVVVNVPAGTIVISTPYTPAHPFNLGTLNLSADGQTLSTTPVPFGDPLADAAVDPGQISGGTPTAAQTSNGVTITDTRAGSTGWAASAQMSEFTNTNPAITTTIPGDNLTFSSIAPKFITGNALNVANVTTVPTITQFGLSGKKVFANATAGPGTVNITGKLGLTAPTSTQPGDYQGTLTFTVS
jgi:hypothetical protein